MSNSKVLKYLIEELKNENQSYEDLVIPNDIDEQKNVFRSLINIRMPKTISRKFLEKQDQYLQEEVAKKGIVSINEIPKIAPNISLWQGDITRLAVDAIVNAANSKMLGCFVPCHNCIDNAIHSAAGIELRDECAEIMEAQGFDEPTGKAKITAAYNLPAKHVIHTVGPIVYDRVTNLEIRQLESCYSECLKLADENRLTSIAFCCISTGVFRFPNEQAAQIAVKTVQDYLTTHKTNLEVVFNVFKDNDKEIYERLLS